MYQINLKPVSLNEAYIFRYGKRIKSEAAREYKESLSYLIPKEELEDKGKYKIELVFGLSSRGADGDNYIKLFQDTLCERCGINDNKIYRWEVDKVIVKKGEEFIKYNLEKYE